MIDEEIQRGCNQRGWRKNGCLSLKLQVRFLVFQSKNTCKFNYQLLIYRLMQQKREEPEQKLEDILSQLIVRDSYRNSIRITESGNFSNIQSYQQQLQISSTMEEDFQLRNSYRRSIFIQHPQSQSQRLSKKVSITQKQDIGELQQAPKKNKISQNALQSKMSENALQSIIPVTSITESQNNETPITILLILVSQNEIQSVATVNEKKVQTKLKISKKKILDNYAALALFKMRESEINNHSIKYTIKTQSLFIISRTKDKTTNFGNLILHGEAGLLCKDISQDSPDLLVNCCLIQGHQHLVKHLQQLQKLNINIFKLYYEIFKKHFKVQSQNISEFFKSISIDKSNSIFSQFFLYFIFILYRQKTSQILQKHNLYEKLSFNRNSLPTILQKKRYTYYQNGQYFKQFLVYSIFTYGYTIFSQNLYSFLKITKIAIVQLPPLKVKSIFNMLQKLKSNEIMSNLLEAPNINAIFINNKEISFMQYFQAMLKYCEIRISQLRSSGNIQQMTDLLLNLLIKLNSKSHINRLTQQEQSALPHFEKRLCSLFKHKSQYNLQIKRLGQVYMQIKALYRISPQIGQVILIILKDHIFTNIQVLLKEFFTSIIYPLVILPELAQQKTVLIDFFMKKQIQTQNIIVLIKFLQYDSKLFNYQMIQVVLEKYLKLNPFISEFKVQELKKCVEHWFIGQKARVDRKKILYGLVQLLEAKKEIMSNQQNFQRCINEIKASLNP